MSGDIQLRVYGWVDQQVNADPERGPLRCLVLSHVNASDQLQEIARYAMTADNAAEVKAEIFRTAIDVVTAWKHLQRFTVQAYFGEATTAGSYYPFAIADDTPESGPQPTEPANLVGMLRQQMRHNEIMAKINAGIMAESNALLLSQSKQAYSALDELRVRFSALLQHSDETLRKRASEEFEQRRILEADQRRGKMAESVQSAVPIIVNRVSEHLGGPKLLPEGRSPLELMVTRLLRKVGDGDVEKLLGLFPDPADQALILEMLRSHVRPDAGGSNGAH